MKPITCLQGAQTLARLTDAEGRSLTHLQIQKILYFADMLHIGKHGPDNPLIEEKFSTWIYGSAVDMLYERLKKYEEGPVEIDAFDDVVPMVDRDSQEPREVINSVLRF